MMAEMRLKALKQRSHIQEKRKNPEGGKFLLSK